MLRAVSDVGTVLGQATFVAQLLVTRAIVLGEAPTLGHEDLGKNKQLVWLANVHKTMWDVGIDVNVCNMVYLNALRPMDMRKKDMEYIASGTDRLP